MRPRDPDDPNAGGNHRKNLRASLEASLRRLRTDYVDLLWLHLWDFLTPVEEVLRAIDDLVWAGKVLYAAPWTPGPRASSRPWRKRRAGLGQTPSHVALNWVRAQGDLPILGARSEAQQRENLGCLEFSLDAKTLRKLDQAAPVELGFPHDFQARPNVRQALFGNLEPRIRKRMPQADPGRPGS